jgi:hypothetical protein
MATSGSTSFNLDVANIIEEAYERCGLELRTSYDLITARRSIDLLLTEWSNYQVNIWKVAQRSLALVADTAEYTINDPIIDVLDGVIRITGPIDIPMARISFEEYLNRTDKAQTGRPTQFATRRERDSLKISFWNTPDVSTYTFEYFSLEYIQEAGVYTNNLDIPRRFLPALCAGLAYKLAQKNPPVTKRNKEGEEAESGGVNAKLRAELKGEYKEAFNQAMYEDRDRSSFLVKPRIIIY